MKCKFCFAALQEDMTVCPECGKQQEEEQSVTEATMEEEQTVVEATAEEEQSAAEEPAVEAVPETEAAAAEITEEMAVEVEEALKKKKAKLWRTVLAAVGGLALLVVLVGAALYVFRANDLYCKDSYTISNKRIGKKSDVVIATIGDREFTVADLQIYYWMSVSNFLSEYGNYISLVGLDLSKPLDEQICDPSTGMTFQQMFLQMAIDEWLNTAAMMLLAEEAGFTISQEDQAYLDGFKADLAEAAAKNGYEDPDAFAADVLAPGSTFDAYVKYNNDNYIAITYYNTIFESMIPSTEEAEAYFAEHEKEMTTQGYGKDQGSYYNVRHILIPIEGGKKGENGTITYTDAEWEACRAKAQKLLDEFLAGDATEEAFAELAAKHSTDTGSKDNGGLYSLLTEKTNFVEEFKQWYLKEERQVGDTGLVKSQYGYHIMYFSFTEPIWLYESKATMLGDNTVAMLEAAQEKWSVEINYKKIVLGFLDLTGYGGTTY